MTSPVVRECQCPFCQQAAPHPDRERHRQMNVFLSRLDEAQRRWYVALEAERLGLGGERLLAQITGLDEKTVRRGRAELALSNRPTGCADPAGGGLQSKKRSGDHNGFGDAGRAGDRGRSPERAEVGA
jgi:hypothetical protein